MKRQSLARSFKLRALALPLLVGACALGCGGTRLISGGPFAGALSTPEGTVRYSLSKSVVTVEATVTHGTSGKVSFDGNDFTVDTKLVKKDAKAYVSISSVADPDQFFTLRLEHGDSSDESLSIDVAPNGTLRSIGITSTSQLGNTIKNVATTVASIAAAVASGALSGDPRRQAVSLVCEKLADDAGTPGQCPAELPSKEPDRPPAPPLKGNVKGESKGATRVVDTRTDTTPGSSSATPTCDTRVKQDLTGLSMESLYFLAKSSTHRRLWQTARHAEGRLAERTCKRIEIERELERASSRDIETLRTRLQTIILLEATARTDLRAATAELDRAVRTFQVETGIDGPRRTEVVRMTFDLDEIPPPEMLRLASDPDPGTRMTGMSDTQAREALRTFPRILELYDRTGIALSLTPAPYAARGGTVWEGAQGGPPKAHIYYRPSYTATLTTYTTIRTTDAQGGEQDLLRLSAVLSDDVIHPKMPVLGFAFDPETFAQRKMAIQFDDKGRLARFEQEGKSSVVGATAAASDAVRTIRDEYSATLTRIAEIQDTQRRLNQNDLITEIDRLRKQRELLDARLELSGARGNYDLLLERKRLDAELAVAQGRRALGDEKSSTALSSEMAELRSKLEQLSSEIDALKSEGGARSTVLTGGD